MAARKVLPQIKLHVALREGLHKVRECRGQFIRRCVEWNNDLQKHEPFYEACAIGTGYFGADGKPGDEANEHLFSDTFREQRDFMVNYLRKRCGPIVDAEVVMPLVSTVSSYRIPEWIRPVFDETDDCTYVSVSTPVKVIDAVEGLFEVGHWSIKDIADWLTGFEGI